MSMTTLFKDFGKSINDLLTKKFEYKNSIAFHNDASKDLRFEQSVTQNEKGLTEGTLKTVYKSSTCGEFEATFGTNNKLEGKIKSNKIVNDKLHFTVSAKQRPSINLTTEYYRDHATASGAIEYSSDSTNIEGAVTVHHEALGLGVKGKYDISKSELSDFGAAFEYKNSNLTATLATEDRAEKLVASFYHPLASGKTIVGGQCSLNVANPSVNRTLSIVGQHEAERTLLKGKVDAEGVISGIVEQRLMNPQVRFALAAQWTLRNGRKDVSPDKFGVGFTFGDYK